MLEMWLLMSPDEYRGEPTSIDGNPRLLHPATKAEWAEMMAAGNAAREASENSVPDAAQPACPAPVTLAPTESYEVVCGATDST